MAWRPWDNIKFSCYLVNQPKIIGHRGCAGLFPENSLAACRHAINLSLDGIEIDVQLSADGEVIVYHDFTINHNYSRHNNMWLDETGKAVKALNHSDLMLYNIGMTRPRSSYRQRRRGQTQLDHEGIPTLRQIFSLVKDTAPSTFRIWIEIKTHPLSNDISADPFILVDKIIELIQQFDNQSHVVIMSFDWRSLKYALQQQPSLYCAFLTCEHPDDDTVGRHEQKPSPWLGGYNLQDHQGSLPYLVKAAGGHYWVPSFQDISKDDIAIAHEVGLQIYTWTVNQRSAMQRLARWGVDGIISDYPNRWYVKKV